MNKPKYLNHLLFVLIALLCFLPFFSPALALALGLVLSLLGFKHPKSHYYSSRILQLSIILMGFGMSLSQVIEASKHGFVETAISVTVVMVLGIVLGKLFKVEKNISLLIASGTAICGGSAIAAVSPVIRSEDYQNSFALMVVFVLNAVALVIFPFIGHYFHMSQYTFGNWAAIAIHDTSSVVGAGATYGSEALQVATTVKLIRALWIIPLSLIIALFQKHGDKKAIRIPWFILFFVVAIIIANIWPQPTQLYSYMSWGGKKLMGVALFLIGANISVSEIKKSGFKSFALGLTLWCIISIVSFLILV